MYAFINMEVKMEKIAKKWTVVSEEAYLETDIF